METLIFTDFLLHLPPPAFAFLLRLTAVLLLLHPLLIRRFLALYFFIFGEGGKLTKHFVG